MFDAPSTPGDHEARPRLSDEVMRELARRRTRDDEDMDVWPEESDLTTGELLLVLGLIASAAYVWITILVIVVSTVWGWF